LRETKDEVTKNISILNESKAESEFVKFESSDCCSVDACFDPKNDFIV
jgi:hypothetical protein